MLDLNLGVWEFGVGCLGAARGKLHETRDSFDGLGVEDLGCGPRVSWSVSLTQEESYGSHRA